MYRADCNAQSKAEYEAVLRQSYLPCILIPMLIQRGTRISL